MKRGLAEVKGSDVVCGVIGTPIRHTRSPQIHNRLAEEMEKEVVYVPFHVNENNLEDAIKGAYALEIKGLNVTMPHKQALFNYISLIDESAAQVGAINTLVYTLEGYKGYNTDAIGLQMSLQEEEVKWQGKNVAIIGSGGAAYATYVAVAKEARSVHIFNRTVSRAEALKKHMSQYFDCPTFVYGEEEIPSETVDIVIQTTGLGMGALKEQVPRWTENVLKNAQVAVDLIYEPQETLFLKMAKERGCKCINGFGMLFYQAVRAFELMHSVNCKEIDLQGLKKELI